MSSWTLAADLEAVGEGMGAGGHDESSLNCDSEIVIRLDMCCLTVHKAHGGSKKKRICMMHVAVTS